MNDLIVFLDNISYIYPTSKIPVLSDITLKVKRGEFLGIIGPTGAGKSTLCLTMNGIVPQFFGGRFFGAVTVAGMDTLDYPISTLATHVGAVFEDPETQIVTASVRNEVAFAMENFCFPVGEIFSRVPEVLEIVRLDGTEDKHPQELSGGQKQRLAIAAALAFKPDLLVLDEPTSQLDPVGTQEVFSVARELNRELGMTIVMASHAAEEMAEHADHIALMSEGRILAEGSPDRIYSDVELLEQHSLRPPEVAKSFFLIGGKSKLIEEIPVRLSSGFTENERLLNTGPNIKPTYQVTQNKSGDTPIFRVKDLHHTYPDGTEALHGISLDISKGEYVLIIGQNGAGKSTLVKHFLKLLSPTEGIVTVDGVDTSELSVSQLAKKIGYVAQNPDNQIFNTTVYDEVSFALKNLKFNKEVIQNRTNESLEAMGLLKYKDHHPLSLPRGDRARVVIAAILAMEPEIIIFDEPTTGQDFRGSQYILGLSKKLHSMGKTVIVITHHLYLMPDYAERVVVMGKGTVILDAPIRKAFHETDLLQSTYLTPPQAVLLSQDMTRISGIDLPLLTPKEFADSIKHSTSGGDV